MSAPKRVFGRPQLLLSLRRRRVRQRRRPLRALPTAQTRQAGGRRARLRVPVRTGVSAGKAVPSADLALVRRAGRIVAIQAAVGLAALLPLNGAVVAGAFLRTQSTQIADQLNTVAQRADDTDDPPPGMELAMRDGRGRISASDGGKVGIPLLSGPVRPPMCMTATVTTGHWSPTVPRAASSRSATWRRTRRTQPALRRNSIG